MRFWGEGSNTVDPILTIRFANPGGSYGVSMLRLDQGLGCMALVNSYNDAGSDITLRKLAGTSQQGVRAGE